MELVMIVAGLLICMAALYAIIKGLRVARWPTTLGTVTTAQVVHSADDGGQYASIAVTYRYTIGGKTYFGHRVRFGGASYIDCKQGVPPKYQRGSDVEVRYDPRNPSESALEIGVASYAIWMLVGGAMCAALGHIFGGSG